jgi:SAM-dependent methyltransferase
MTSPAQSFDESDVLRRLVNAPELFAAMERETGPELPMQSRLRERFDPELVRTALEVADLRRRGADKFSRAARMWFTRVGLEQATPEPVARHKAKRFADIREPVWDLCCGVGGDALALAEYARVIAIDRDPAACLRTELNAAVYGVADRVETRAADVTTLDLAGGLVHVDPDRRAGATRARRIEQFSPDLPWLQELTRRARGGAIKVSPASNFGGKFPDAEVELVSLHGECKEATIWFGESRGELPWRATVLPAGETLAGRPLEVATDVRPPGRYAFDPDPAVVRAGLVDHLAARLGLWRLDDAEEYLSGDEVVDSPFVAPFEIVEELPNNETEVRQAIRRREWGSVEIKCRHVPLNADQLRKRLPLQGREAGVLIYARLQGKTRVLLCRRVPVAPQTE